MLVLGLIMMIVPLLLFSIPTESQKLINAVEANDTVAVRTLLESGVNPNCTSIKPSKLLSLLETEAKRPLTIACQEGNLQIVQLLIEYGATAEYIEGTGWSPLRTTLFYYQPDDPQIIELLLENGADPNVAEDISPVFAAAQMIPKVFNPQEENSSVFLGGYDQKTAEGITNIVTALLGENSVNITTPSGQTLLMLAVKQENLHLTEHLLRLGCDVNLKDRSGKSALDYARETNNHAIVALLQ